MKVFSLTKTLDKYVDFYTDDATEAEILVVGGSHIDLKMFPKLKYIFKCGVGTDNIPFDELDYHDVKLVLPSYKTQCHIYDEVAAYTLYLILNHQYIASGSMYDWTKVKRSCFRDKKILVVGATGNIGSRVTRALKTMVDNVIEYDVTTTKPLKEILPEMDIITLHCPLFPETKNMIDLNLLKEDVVLINTSRAQLVDEDELFDFLEKNKEARAIFDVFWKEPYTGKLMPSFNFWASPHVASSTEAFVKGLYDDLCNLMEKNK